MSDYRKDIQHILDTGWCAIDTETTGLDLFHSDRPFAVSCCDESGNTYFHRGFVDPFTREVFHNRTQLSKLKSFINPSTRFLVFHNSRFDIRGLHLGGILNLSIDWDRVHDTHPFSHVLCSNDSHGLKQLGEKYLQTSSEDEKELQRQTIHARAQAKKLSWTRSEHVPADAWMPYQLDPTAPDILQEYAVKDAIRTSVLFHTFLHVCLTDPEGETFWKLYCEERQLLPVVYEMERNGVSIKSSNFALVRKKLRTAVAAATRSISRISRLYSNNKTKLFNHRSVPQLRTILYDNLNLPVFNSTDGAIPQPSTDAATLRMLQEHTSISPDKDSVVIHRFLTDLLDVREGEKSLAFLTDYQERSLREPYPFSSQILRTLVRSSFNPWGTHTTRFSSNSINLQNVDKLLREVFGPTRDAFWIDNDYDNLEMRIYAYDAQEPSLIEAFEHNESVHMIIARELHPQLVRKNKLTKDSPEYRRTKNGNFALIYGASSTKVDATYGVPGAYAIISKKFPGLIRYIRSITSEAERNGYITTLFGYRLYLPKTQSYAASNYRIQGTAGGVMKKAMLNVHSFLKEYSTNFGLTIGHKSPRIILTVHDQLVVEAPLFLSPEKTDCPEINNQLVTGIARCMSSPGNSIGVPTPVSCSLVFKDWSQGIPYTIPV